MSSPPARASYVWRVSAMLPLPVCNLPNLPGLPFHKPMPSKSSQFRSATHSRLKARAGVGPKQPKTKPETRYTPKGGERHSRRLSSLRPPLLSSLPVTFTLHTSVGWRYVPQSIGSGSNDTDEVSVRETECHCSYLSRPHIIRANFFRQANHGCSLPPDERGDPPGEEQGEGRQDIQHRGGQGASGGHASGVRLERGIGWRREQSWAGGSIGVVIAKAEGNDSSSEKGRELPV